MSVLETLEKAQKDPNVTIYATDIDREALEVAKKGEYSDFSGISPGLIEKYTEKLPGGKYRFNKKITDMIKFLRHDIFADRPLKNFDVIFCRNTIIYFNSGAKKHLYQLFNNSLIMGGVLVLGKAESFIEHRRYEFEVFERKSHIFKKIKGI
jgi:chemotaxis methyl-accepting protein methylase